MKMKVHTKQDYINRVIKIMSKYTLLSVKREDAVEKVEEYYEFAERCYADCTLTQKCERVIDAARYSCFNPMTD